MKRSTVIVATAVVLGLAAPRGVWADDCIDPMLPEEHAVGSTCGTCPPAQGMTATGIGRFAGDEGHPADKGRTPKLCRSRPPVCLSDPVVVTSGEEVESAVDLVVPGRSAFASMRLSRNYRSREDVLEGLGHGWHLIYQGVRLEAIDGSDDLWFYTVAGERYRMTEQSEGVWSAPAGFRAELTQASGEPRILTFDTGETYTFSDVGRLTKLADADLNLTKATGQCECATSPETRYTY